MRTSLEQDIHRANLQEMVVVSTFVKSIKIRVKAAIAKKSENSLKMDLK
jgi:hypothetical protein